ncbi:hypothetical protein FHT10_004009 [Xanthomonas arboricola]|nr:hypothetical protein [Xanthomonas cannabis]
MIDARAQGVAALRALLTTSRTHCVLAKRAPALGWMLLIRRCLEPAAQHLRTPCAYTAMVQGATG